MTFTVVVMEPCCVKSEPGYDPGPRPVWHRFPDSWPPSCNHWPKRVLTITEHETRETAEPEYAKTLGWDAYPGYLHEGAMPPEGERFRIMVVSGDLTRGYFHAAPEPLVFPTAELAAGWVEKKRALYNIVGDQDQRVRLSSYGVPVGTELLTGEPA
ncbi:hypothetical protein JK364_23695 [Streptomyces sp. 110]|uniref:Uncharacterized protein n=1 Tax=Streptomyces endocoffeicus TaxID=2898945 RepID=A0ABS1PSI4_9ACTN|nr:hypothetical protein [Streptomyces endocoffeicus]MBL1115378.1 hypothetical protein [Streptomyces endocoffeicus]